MSNGIASELDLSTIEINSKEEVKKSKKDAWEAYLIPIIFSRKKLIFLLKTLYDQNTNTELNLIIIELNNIKEPNNSDLLSSARKTLRLLINEKNVNTELSF